MSNSLPLDFHILHFCGEVRPSLGEDNWCYGFNATDGMIAVFDGCGGAGARKHVAYTNHSEAFMSSRLCSGVLYECMQKHAPIIVSAEEFVEKTLAPYLVKRIVANIPPKKANGVRIKGMRTLPTTMAAALIRSSAGEMISVSPIWAGDSRVYILDSSGLSQLTIDDTNQPDPLEGLYDDGTLTNMICGDRQFVLNHYTVNMKPPFMVIATTDGCFGYVSTPMEFEGMILHTMLESDNVSEWEDNLRKLIASYAGDDHTMCLASFGYGDFASIQKNFSQRYGELRKKYLETIWSTPWEDRDTRRKLWSEYKSNYLKYIKDKSK